MFKFNFNDTHEHKLLPTVLFPLGRVICKIAYDTKVYGIENIPEQGGVILASNHVTALDPFFIQVLQKKRYFHFFSKIELFKNPIIAFFMVHMNAVPVVRGNRDRSAIDFSVKLVTEGKALGIFPEGTRTTDGNLLPPKSGTAYIAKATKADIIPVAIIQEKGSKKVTIRFGKIIKSSELNFSDSINSKELREASKLIMQRIYELREEGHCQ